MPNFRVDFSGKTAIITGAGAGIGKAAALALAQAGASIVVNDLNPDRVDRLVNEITASGGKAVGFDGDISNRFQVAALIERARDAFGQIHFLVNAAGVYKAEPLTLVDEWDFRRQVEVNLIGTFFCIQLLSRVMADEGGGVIVNLASTAGHPKALEQGIGYVSSKAGVVGLTKQAAQELAVSNIRVNTICPAYIDENDMPKYENPPNAMKRMGSGDEVANLILFLLSDAAAFITGQAINIDGGESYT
jgi:3-oxoacyl-[acyl-carrier protein] reductase